MCYIHVQNIPDRPIQAKKQKRNPFFQVLEHRINQALGKKERIAQSKFGVIGKYKKGWQMCLQNFLELLFFAHSWTRVGEKRNTCPQYSLNTEALRKTLIKFYEMFMYCTPIKNFTIFHSYGYYNKHSHLICHLQSVSVVFSCLPKGSAISCRLQSVSSTKKGSLRASWKVPYHLLWIMTTKKQTFG